MTLVQLFVGWFYYGIIYMGLSILATFMLNKVVKKLWLVPLLINAIAIVLLLIGAKMNFVPYEEQAFALYFVYMPIVFASIIFNLSINIKRKVETLWI